MKMKQHIKDNDEMREEYDLASMKGGVRGKYAEAIDHTTTTVLLDSDVAEAFPDSQSVNEALRKLARSTQR